MPDNNPQTRKTGHEGQDVHRPQAPGNARMRVASSATFPQADAGARPEVGQSRVLFARARVHAACKGVCTRFLLWYQALSACACRRASDSGGYRKKEFTNFSAYPRKTVHACTHKGQVIEV
jgi:hypothetical protein